MKKLIIVVMLISACNFASAQDRGTFQHWEFDYTARELLKDCEQKDDKCLFFIRTVAQASFWFDKCIPNGTSIMEIEDVMQTFIDKNPQYIDSGSGKSEGRSHGGVVVFVRWHRECGGLDSHRHLVLPVPALAEIRVPRLGP